MRVCPKFAALCESHQFKMPPKSRRRGTGRGKAKSEEISDVEEELPPPPPPRPFKEVEGLPLSIDEPSYSILNNALSLKDSAVLYSSLMRSRKSYTSGNIFDLYWAKGKTKFDNDVNARDRMNKFCDCAMNIGPHNFDVRFFILKDEEVEKKRQDEKEKKKEKRLAAKKIREEKQRLRELKNKAKQEGLASDSVDPQAASDVQDHQAVDTKPSGTTQATSHPTPNDENSSNQPTVVTKVEDEQEDQQEDQHEEGEDSDDNESDHSEKSRESSAQPTSKENTQPVSEGLPTPDAQAEEEKADKSNGDNLDTPVRNEALESQQPTSQNEESSQTTPVKTSNRPLPPLQVQNQEGLQNQPTSTAETQQPESDIPPASTSTADHQPSSSQPVQPQQQHQPPTQPPPPPAQNDIMQTPESQMMIANLNVIARAEPALNTLMKIVATGNARPEQIREFQGYIQRAKAMGPTQYYKQAFGNSSPAVVNQPPTPTPKPPKKPKAPKKPKPPKEKQLTTFQEMYVDGADLVFEFNENPNIRYHLPKESIIEKLDNGFLVSFLVIHNREEIKRWKNRQETKKAKREQKEKEAKEKEEDIKKEDEAKEDTLEGVEKEKVEKVTRRTRKSSEKESVEREVEDNEKAEKEQREKELKEKEEKDREAKEAKEAAENQEPVTYFSAMSFTLTNISQRFLQIFQNSFNKPEEVLPQMEKTLKEGIRVPKHYLWYSVDAYEDENLAESLREALYLIENPPKGKNRKRAHEENPIIGNAAAKKVKKET